MRPVCTPDEMSAADRRTIEGGTPQPVLMARAAAAVARAARRELGGVYGRRAVVVAGKGNNGGDGLIAGDRLTAAGVRVERFHLGELGRPQLQRAVARADVLIDAMFGTGFRGALDGDAAFAAELLAAAEAPVVAVDIPSGVDGATGEAGAASVRADRTVCFAALKRGLVFEPGRSLTGHVEVADIGVDVGDTGVAVVEDRDVGEWLTPRPADANKWASGLLVAGGSRGMTGAPVFVSRAAMRAGAGIVYCALPGAAAVDALSGAEIVLRALAASDAGGFATDAARELAGLAPRFRAAALGPGLGSDGRASEMVRRAVAELPLPLVIDADGLNALAGDLAPLRVRNAAGLPPAILTPHDGEYARLAGHRPGADRVAETRALAEATGAVVLLKGPTTVVSEPGGRVALSTTGGPELASAGTGDVLTGIIGAFCARGLPPFAAAAAGAHVHGRSAQTAGPSGLVAGDLVDALPRTLVRFGRLEEEQD